MSRHPSSPGAPGLQIIHAGLFRTGTASMAAAYRLLGYKAHHGLDDVWNNPWSEIEEAAEATWPQIPNARPRKPFTRADWDRVWGAEYDVVTDLGSPFVDQLIKAYPDAKVVIVQRDFDAWWPSFRSELIGSLFTPIGAIQSFILTNILRNRAAAAMRKIYFGFFHAKNVKEIEAQPRATYEAYYKRIRDLVPPERRLEYRLGSGWQPLCAFLGADVPAVDFPRENDRQSHAKGRDNRALKMYIETVRTMGPYLIALAAVVASGGLMGGYFNVGNIASNWKSFVSRA